MKFSEREKILRNIKAPPDPFRQNRENRQNVMSPVMSPVISSATSPIKKIKEFIKRNVRKICISIFDTDISMLNALKVRLGCSKSEVMRRALSYFYYLNNKGI